MLHLNAGALDQRITIQAATTVDNTLGEPIPTWATLATVWAQAQPLRGREYFAAGQIQDPQDVRFRIRWRDDITTAMRVLWRGVPHAVQAVIDVDGARQVIELMCQTGVRDGQ